MPHGLEQFRRRTHRHERPPKSEAGEKPEAAERPRAQADLVRMAQLAGPGHTARPAMERFGARYPNFLGKL